MSYKSVSCYRLNYIGLCFGFAALLALSACGGGKAGLKLGGGDSAGPAPSASEMRAQLESEMQRLGVDPKRALAAPGPGNAVFDLRAKLIDPDLEGPLPPDSVRLTWTERVLGDYDQNGEVNASDLSPLGSHYGLPVSYLDPFAVNGIEWWPAGDPTSDGQAAPLPPLADSGSANWRLARIDGDFNGETGLSDITPIASHWQERLDGYRIYEKAPGANDFSLLPDPDAVAVDFSIPRSKAFPGGQPDPNRPLLYSIELPLSALGEYQYYVAPYDAGSDTEGPASAIVTPKLNQPPVAALSADVLAGNAPLSVSFSAGSSFDPDGGTLSYSWDFDSSDAVIDIEDGSDPDLSHVYPVAGSFTARVIVSDPEGIESVASVDIVVDEAFQAVVKASPESGIVPFVTNLDPSGSISSHGITLYEYDLDNDGTYDQTIQAGQGKVEMPVTQVGDHVVTLRITDGLNNTTTSTVTVHGYGKVHAELSADDQINTAETILESLVPVTIRLDASGSVGRGNLSYQFIHDNEVPFSHNGPIGAVTYSAPGEHVFTVVVTDELGDSDQASIVLSEQVAPVASVQPFGPGPFVVGHEFSVTAAGSTDADGAIVKYEWDIDDDGSIDEDTGANPILTAPAISSGFHSIKVIVTDNDGHTAEGLGSVEVVDPEVTATFTTSPGFGQAPLDTTFDASGSSTLSGAALNYQWDWDTDGTIDTTTQNPVANHTFVDPGPSLVTLKVTDADGITDSYAVSVYALGGLTIIRDDGDSYPANLNALQSDLDELGVSYSVVNYSNTIVADYLANPQPVIWYRGGQGAGAEPAPDVRLWTDERIDNYIGLLNAGAPLLLMAQNIGFYDGAMFNVTYSWNAVYGCQIENPSCGAYPPAGTPDPRRHSWAAGIGTDGTVGLGGVFGYFPSAPTSFSGTIAAKNSADSVGGAEYYSVGSGYSPTSVSFDASRQFSGVGFNSTFINGGIASATFRPGLAVDPDNNGFDIGYLSWGNLAAPDSAVGEFPNYTHNTGPGKLWIVGYPWAGTVVEASTPDRMNRSDMLLNILAWLTQ